MLKKEDQGVSSVRAKFKLEPAWDVRYERSGKEDIPSGPRDNQNFISPDGVPFLEGTLDLTYCPIGCCMVFPQRRNFVEAIVTATGTNNIEVYDMALDASGNIYMTGYVNSTADFDPKSGVTNLTSNGAHDCYVVKLSPTRNLIWARSFGGTSIDQAFAIEVGNNGEVYTAGRFMNSVDFDPSATGTNIVHGNSYDIFIHKLDSAGNFELVYAYGDNDLYGESARGLYFDANENLYVTGLFVGTKDFDLGADSTILSSNALNKTSSFLMKYSDVMVTGTKEIIQKTSVKLFPNPTTGTVIFESNEEIELIEIYSLTGQKVNSFTNTNNIDISEFTPGIYIARVIAGNKIATKRIIKE